MASMAATVVGITTPSGAKNLEIKPYVTSSASGQRTSGQRMAADVSADIGVDVKYGIAQNIIADFTYNTDFAQVEADQQQVNLTRFSLFFPEKRDFFLENAGTFSFGGAASGAGAGASDTPILFYSRRVGLSKATPCLSMLVDALRGASDATPLVCWTFGRQTASRQVSRPRIFRRSG